MKRFENHVVVVTGASRGIGQAIAIAFAREGAQVVGVARSEQQETAAQVKAAGGGFISLTADLSGGTQKEAFAIVDQILTRTGRIDVLINNAGIIPRAPAVDYSEDDWNKALRTNLSSPFFLMQAVAIWWLRTGKDAAPQGARLKIVNIASLLSFQGGIFVPAYTASKHAIAGLTKALANEWASQRINVNAGAPGYIATDITQALQDDPKRNRTILERIPEGRWGVPADVAGGCVFLASREADYLNGAILNIDGGWLGR